MSGLNDLFPRAEVGQPPLHITEFTLAYELHLAAEGTTLFRNRQEDPSDRFTPEQRAARKQFLDISRSLLIAERDKILDQFCISWQAYRVSLAKE